MSNDRGLICAYFLDGQGGGTAPDWTGVETWAPEQGVLWMHLDRGDFTACSGCGRFDAWAGNRDERGGRAVRFPE